MLKISYKSSNMLTIIKQKSQKKEEINFKLIV